MVNRLLLLFPDTRRMVMRALRCLCALACVALAACTDEATVPLPYDAINHTNEHIVAIVVNGEGGVLNAPAHSGGGSAVCCVILPTRWTAGMNARIAWQMDGDWARDAQGEPRVENGKKVFVPGPWKESVVQIPHYARKDLDHVDLHFFDDRVEILVSRVYENHPDYPERLKLRRTR